MACANQETPKTRVPRIALIISSVFFAFTPSGTLNRATPSEIASRPVSDEPPLANARIKINMAAKLSKPFAWPI